MPTDENTEGKKLVGANFNPNENPDVTEIRELAAKLIDKINAVHEKREAPTYNTNLIHGEATRRVMDASMWCVKDVTWEF